MEFRAQVEIEASPEEVFSVLTDFPRYPTWNPFTIEAKVGATGPGSVVDLLVVMNAQPRWQRLTMRTFKPPTGDAPGILAWGMSWPMLLRAERVQRVMRVGDHARYESFEEMTGPLAPLVGLLYGDAIRESLGKLTQSLAERVSLQGAKR